MGVQMVKRSSEMSKKNIVMVDRDVLKQLDDEREQAIVQLEMAVEIIKKQHAMLLAAGISVEK